GALGVAVLLDEDDGVGVELDVGTVGAAGGLGGADDDGLGLVAGLDVRAGEGLLDGDHHAVAHAGRAAGEAAGAGGAAVDADDVRDLRARVVRDLAPGFLLKHSVYSVGPPPGGSWVAGSPGLDQAWTGATWLLFCTTRT